MKKEQFDVLKAKWFPNKLVVSVLISVIAATAVLTWNVAVFYNDVANEKKSQVSQHTGINKELKDLRVDLKIVVENNNELLKNNNKLLENNNNLVRETLDMLRANVSTPLKKTQPVVMIQ